MIKARERVTCPAGVLITLPPAVPGHAARRVARNYRGPEQLSLPYAPAARGGSRYFQRKYRAASIGGPDLAELTPIADTNEPGYWRTHGAPANS
jgi:hypothetical protein